MANDTTFTCLANKECSALLDLLRGLSVPDGLIKLPDDSCAENKPNKPWPCDAMLHNARVLCDTVGLDNSDQVFSYLFGLFADKRLLLDHHSGDSMDRFSFRCPDIGVEIYQPCAVSSCSFFCNNKWFKNCILYYRLRHEREALSVNELSFLLNKDSLFIRSQISKTIRQLGHYALKEIISHEGISGASRRLSSVNRVCVVCEHIIPDDEREINRGGFCYCSQKCVDYKPPASIKIEQEFNLPIEKVLSICTSKFSSVKNMCNALNIGQSVFMALCSRYGIEIPARSYEPQPSEDPSGD